MIDKGKKTTMQEKKAIKSVTKEGIEYVDELGNLQFIDFEVCYQNFLEHKNEQQIPYMTEELKRTNTVWKCVGQRNICGNPPYIELFTDPLTRFEFDSPDQGFYELDYRIRKTGWKTFDLT